MEEKRKRKRIQISQAELVTRSNNALPQNANIQTYNPSESDAAMRERRRQREEDAKQKDFDRRWDALRAAVRELKD